MSILLEEGYTFPESPDFSEFSAFLLGRISDRRDCLKSGVKNGIKFVFQIL